MLQLASISVSVSARLGVWVCVCLCVSLFAPIIFACSPQTNEFPKRLNSDPSLLSLGSVPSLLSLVNYRARLACEATLGNWEMATRITNSGQHRTLLTSVQIIFNYRAALSRFQQLNYLTQRLQREGHVARRGNKRPQSTLSQIRRHFHNYIIINIVKIYSICAGTKKAIELSTEKMIKGKKNLNKKGSTNGVGYARLVVCAVKWKIIIAIWLQLILYLQ